MLVPGCASFDMFSGFEERGQVFREAVGELKKDSFAPTPGPSPASQERGVLDILVVRRAVPLFSSGTPLPKHPRKESPTLSPNVTARLIV
jgi:hypothetical protein